MVEKEIVLMEKEKLRLLVKSLVSMKQQITQMEGVIRELRMEVLKR